MKKATHDFWIILGILVGAYAIIFMLACWFQPIRKAKEYPTCGEVVEVDYENDLVVVEDFNGNLWEFEGCEDWLEGDIASMIMNDCGTPEIYDDEIVTVKYSGYVKN